MCACSLSRMWVECVAKIVEATATPIAPPTCWDVLMRPEARPCSSRLTPPSAAIESGTNANPMPMPTST